MSNEEIYNNLYELCMGDLNEMESVVEYLSERLESDKDYEEKVDEIFKKFKLSKNYTKDNFKNICEWYDINEEDALYFSAYSNVDEMIEEYKELERLEKEV